MQLMSRFVVRSIPTSMVALAMLVGLFLSMAQSEPAPTDPPAPAETSISLQQRAGYIAQETAFLGTIYHAMGEPHFLRRGDLALIDVGANGDLNVGDHLTVFSFLPKVRHPHTGSIAGKPIRIMGDAIVTKVNETNAMIRITLAFDEMEVGNRVERFGTLPPQAAPIDAPTRAALLESAITPSGSIISARDNKVALSQGDIVFIDQGAQHGVQQGDHFAIFENARIARHPDTNHSMPVPRQPIGTLSIVDVQDHTATAQVLQSQREFDIGALVQYVASTSGSLGQLANLSNADTLALQIPPCFEQARQAIRAAEERGATNVDLTAARNTLSYAMATFEQAQDLLEEGKRDQAVQLLQAAQSDCLTAQQLAGHDNAFAANRNGESGAGDRYTVRRGDTLWDIAAQPAIYRNPWLWPLLYQANHGHINDPDLIYPQQVLTVPRGYSGEEGNIATHRARNRGPWRLGDGPDTYILQGIRQ
ncbi:MAG: LysM peptidoglycan-binding domain-containing protein [Candidatus Tectomicrobia bacterium]|nr:LysM peptidoglycan-binding domain-containing protein [Candidatus Tectomicrobia bacterium]